MAGQQTFDDVFPPFPSGFTMPFWYASLQSFWLYYAVPLDLIAQKLPQFAGANALAPAAFAWNDNQVGLASIDLQIYTGHGPGYLEYVREVEFNIYAYPVARVPFVPSMTVEQFLAGEDQTKTLGGWRLHVPCDNQNAVNAGIGLFGEPKFLAQFSYTTPCLNAPAVRDWNYTVYQNLAGNQQGPPIFEVSANLDNVIAKSHENPSPLTEYGTFTDANGAHLVSNQWTFYGPFETYYFGNSPNVTLTLGTQPDTTNTIADLKFLLAGRDPIAAQVFTSAPVSSETRAAFQVPL